MGDVCFVSRLNPVLIGLMAFSTGLAVSGNYYAQPLLHTLAMQFELSEAQAGSLVTTAQLGYAVGLLLLVPLGDLFERRRMIVAMMGLSGCGLLITATASSFLQLLLGTAISALFSVVAQVLLPLAATLAAPSERGRVIGVIMSGLLLGILLARTVAGALSTLGSWRTVYWCAALAMFATAVVLRWKLPLCNERVALSYVQLLRSVVQLFFNEPALRILGLISGITFATFSVLWTSMAFLLAGKPYFYSDYTIGLFGLVGAAGALAAVGAGRLADQGKSVMVTMGGLILLLLSWIPIGLASYSIIALLIGVVMLDLAAQAIHVSNQSTIYRLRPDARNRITAAYMVSYFIGGAAGSLLSAMAYAVSGWWGVTGLGIVFSLTGVIVWQNFRQQLFAQNVSK